MLPHERKLVFNHTVLGETNELTSVNSIRWHARNVTIKMWVVVDCEWEMVSFVA